MVIRKTGDINLIQIISLPLWISGVVIAEGFWSTLLAVVIPFWAWYLAVEKLLMHFGVI